VVVPPQVARRGSAGAGDLVGFRSRLQTVSPTGVTTTIASTSFEKVSAATSPPAAFRADTFVVKGAGEFRVLAGIVWYGRDGATTIGGVTYERARFTEQTLSTVAPGSCVSLFVPAAAGVHR
jgi:hypothetical protein